MGSSIRSERAHGSVHIPSRQSQHYSNAAIRIPYPTTTCSQECSARVDNRKTEALTSQPSSANMRSVHDHRTRLTVQYFALLFEHHFMFQPALFTCWSTSVQQQVHQMTVRSASRLRSSSNGYLSFRPIASSKLYSAKHRGITEGMAWVQLRASI